MHDYIVSIACVAIVVVIKFTLKAHFYEIFFDYGVHSQ